MWRKQWTLGMLAVTGAGLFACSSSSVGDGTLTFTINEGLLLTVPETPTLATAVLASGTGNCARFQSGLQYGQIANSNFLYFVLGQLDANNLAQPITGGGYTILDLNGSFTGPGFLANAFIESTDGSCAVTVFESASGGTVTVSITEAADGGGPTASYSAIFNNSRITGNYGLSNCPVSAKVTAPPSGTCVVP